MADAGNYVDGKILWITSQDVKQHYIENTTTMISEKGAATLTLYPRLDSHSRSKRNT
uniref:hypothetical protein n=1 Tax=Bifidobacterium longum TaxID=216816 RepID=UPI0040268AFA